MADFVAPSSGAAPASTPTPRQDGNSNPSRPLDKGNGQGTGNPLTQAARAAEGGRPEKTLGDRIGAGEQTEGEQEAHDQGDDDSDVEVPELSEKQLKKALKNLTTEQLQQAMADVKIRFKVSGQTVEGNIGQLKRMAEQGGRMHEAMEEAASHRKQNEAYQGIVERIRNDPDQFLELGRQLGHDVDEIARKRAYELLKVELMDDQERANYERDKKLEKYESKEQTEKQKQEEEDRRLEAAAAKGRVQNEVFEFFQDKPRPTMPVLERTLEVMIASASRGQRLPIAKAFEVAQNQINQLLDRHLESLPLDRVPPSFKEKVRKGEVARFKQPPSQSASPAERRQPAERPSRPRGPVSTDDWFRSIAQKYESKP